MNSPFCANTHPNIAIFEMELFKWNCLKYKNLNLSKTGQEFCMK